MTSNRPWLIALSYTTCWDAGTKTMGGKKTIKIGIEKNKVWHLKNLTFN